MSALINYLNKFSSPDLAMAAITKELGIKVKEYDDGLVVFNYSQIDSPKTDEVVRECRGAILRYEDGEWYFYCRPFKRFYNYGEAPETMEGFDWSKAEGYEKADGSLIKIYMNPSNEWNIATRGTAYAESENYTGQVFRDMVLDAFGLTEEEFQREANKNLYMGETHLYEFTSPDNRVVTPYEKPEMVYLGSVDNDLGDFGFTAGLVGNCREVKRFYLGSPEDFIAAASELDGLQEGFVVRDLVSGQAVKIKAPLYVAAHHMRGDYGLTPKKDCSVDRYKRNRGVS